MPLQAATQRSSSMTPNRGPWHRRVDDRINPRRRLAAHKASLLWMAPGNNRGHLGTVLLNSGPLQVGRECLGDARKRHKKAARVGPRPRWVGRLPMPAAATCTNTPIGNEAPACELRAMLRAAPGDSHAAVPTPCCREPQPRSGGSYSCRGLHARTRPYFLALPAIEETRSPGTTIPHRRPLSPMSFRPIRQRAMLRAASGAPLPLGSALLEEPGSRVIFRNLARFEPEAERGRLLVDDDELIEPEDPQVDVAVREDHVYAPAN